MYLIKYDDVYSFQNSLHNVNESYFYDLFLIYLNVNKSKAFFAENLVK